jgi:hypothetical protein
VQLGPKSSDHACGPADFGFTCIVSAERAVTEMAVVGSDAKGEAVNAPNIGRERAGFRKHAVNCIANTKYIWRTDRKGGTQDLQKAIWYLNRAIHNLSI